MLADIDKPGNNSLFMGLFFSHVWNLEFRTKDQTEYVDFVCASQPHRYLTIFLGLVKVKQPKPVDLGSELPFKRSGALKFEISELKL